MADLTSSILNGTGISKGQDNVITLNKANLNAVFSDSYFDDTSHWNKIVVTYKSQAGQFIRVTYGK